MQELQEQKTELLQKVQVLKTDLQDWRTKLESQVKSYKTVRQQLQQADVAMWIQQAGTLNAGNTTESGSSVSHGRSYKLSARHAPALSPVSSSLKRTTAFWVPKWQSCKSLERINTPVHHWLCLSMPPACL